MELNACPNTPHIGACSLIQGKYPPDPGIIRKKDFKRWFSTLSLASAFLELFALTYQPILIPVVCRNKLKGRCRPTIRRPSGSRSPWSGCGTKTTSSENFYSPKCTVDVRSLSRGMFRRKKANLRRNTTSKFVVIDPCVMVNVKSSVRPLNAPDISMNE